MAAEHRLFIRKTHTHQQPNTILILNLALMSNTIEIKYACNTQTTH